MFEKSTHLPAILSNNVRALFAAQMFLSHDRCTLSQLFLRCEYGIGASLSMRDEIWSGGNGRCAEIGHIQVVRRGGKPCVCEQERLPGNHRLPLCHSGGSSAHLFTQNVRLCCGTSRRTKASILTWIPFWTPHAMAILAWRALWSAPCALWVRRLRAPFIS